MEFSKKPIVLALLAAFLATAVPSGTGHPTDAFYPSNGIFIEKDLTGNISVLVVQATWDCTTSTDTDGVSEEVVVSCKVPPPDVGLEDVCGAVPGTGGGPIVVGPVISDLECDLTDVEIDLHNACRYANVDASGTGDAGGIVVGRSSCDHSEAEAEALVPGADADVDPTYSDLTVHTCKALVNDGTLVHTWRVMCGINH